MTMSEISRRLREMTIGRTRIINDHAVTRWSDGQYEVDTWGRRHVVELDIACELIEELIED